MREREKERVRVKEIEKKEEEVEVWLRRRWLWWWWRGRWWKSTTHACLCRAVEHWASSEKVRAMCSEFK